MIGTIEWNQAGAGQEVEDRLSRSCILYFSWVSEERGKFPSKPLQGLQLRGEEKVFIFACNY